MKAECCFVGKERTETIEVELKATQHDCFSGTKRFEMNGVFYYVKLMLLSEKVGKVFEAKPKEKE